MARLLLCGAGKNSFPSLHTKSGQFIRDYITTTHGYVHMHVGLEMNHEETLQCRRQLYRQRREEEREERLSRQCKYMIQHRCVARTDQQKQLASYLATM